MGVFTSYCIKCEAKIDWFLTVPQNYYCKQCGEYNPPDEIERSQHAADTAYQNVMQYWHTHTKEQVVELMKDKPIELRVLERTCWRRMIED